MSRNLIDELNRSMPAAAHVKGPAGQGLGYLLQALITNQNAILAKLDALGAAANIAAVNAATGTTNVATLAIQDLVAQGLTAA